jgi:hypothetical protein
LPALLIRSHRKKKSGNPTSSTNANLANPINDQYDVMVVVGHLIVTVSCQGVAELRFQKMLRKF